jgi:exopolyphosphatase/guanosine-5'-triphosphate,3'-diphosphate pyrophosphatase
VTARAAIDIGSNAARLLVADGGQPVLRRSRITGLAEGLTTSGLLSTAALARTATVLEGYRAMLDERGATLARVVGTAAARAAGNADELAGLVADVLGRPLEVLAPEEEARLTFHGAAGGDGRGRRLVVDIGGASTELAVGDVVPEGVASLDLGSAALSAAELRSDPPRPEELSNAIALVQEQVDEALRALPPVDEWTPVIGTGGTVLTIAAVEIGLPVSPASDPASDPAGDPTGDDEDGDRDVDDHALHGFVLARAAAEDVFRTVAGEALTDRMHNPGLPRGRAVSIVGGCCILVGLLRRLQVPAVTVSVTDLLDGTLREAL